MVTEYNPGDRLAGSSILPNAGDQLKVKPGVPPITVRSMLPLFKPAQVSGVVIAEAVIASAPGGTTIVSVATHPVTKSKTVII
jgi:hypothetical protein